MEGHPTGVDADRIKFPSRSSDFFVGLYEPSNFKKGAKEEENIYKI